MSWYVDDNRLTTAELPALPPRYIPPYPDGIWYINDDMLTHTALPEMPPRYVPPYPDGLWYVDDDRLTHSRLPKLLIGGAFSECESLVHISIPKSVKQIGEYAFAGTGLTRVRIADDCIYHPTSFPEGCIIEIYGQEQVTLTT